MKFTVQYIPLSKIKPDLSLKVTEHIKKLQNLIWDCMYILIVKRNKKDGSFTIVSGLERFEYLRKHTKNIYAPCIVDESTSSGMRAWLHRLRHKQPLDDFPMVPASWSIVRSFLKQEPRFKRLSRSEQIKVLLIGARYKKTVIRTMKNKVNEILRNHD